MKEKKAFVRERKDYPEYQRVIDPVDTCGMRSWRWGRAGSAISRRRQYALHEG